MVSRGRNKVGRYRNKVGRGRTKVGRGRTKVGRGRNKVSRDRNKVGRGRKGQVDVENDQVGPGRGRKYPPVPPPPSLYVHAYTFYIIHDYIQKPKARHQKQYKYRLLDERSTRA